MNEQRVSDDGKIHLYDTVIKKNKEHARPFVVYRILGNLLSGMGGGKSMCAYSDEVRIVPDEEKRNYLYTI